MQKIVVYVCMFLLPLLLGVICLFIGRLFHGAAIDSIAFSGATLGALIGIMASIGYILMAQYIYIGAIALVLNIIIFINMVHGLFYTLA